MIRKIDLNADLGEGAGNDAVLMPLLTSCNIACGGHAGDRETIRTAVQLAIRFHVKIGAHPSYPDKENFGRIAMAIDESDLKVSILNQIKTIDEIVRNEGGFLHHIKPHGALYNALIVNDTSAHTMVEVMQEMPDKILYVPEKSVIARRAKAAGINVYAEVFADRNYNDDLTLVSRQHPDAILKSIDGIEEHVMRMVMENKVKTLTGKEMNIHADTVCIHGDNPDAVIIATALHNRLKEVDIKVI